MFGASGQGSNLITNTNHVSKTVTPDQEIIQIADGENLIIITKDRNFLDNYILDGSPKKLLIVSTGNRAPQIHSLLTEYRFSVTLKGESLSKLLRSTI